MRKEFKGNVGLFLVCAELSKMNLVAMPTSRNTKGFDLVALHPDTNKAIGVQVKCSDKKEYPVFSSLWCQYKEAIRDKIRADTWIVRNKQLETYKDKWGSITDSIDK